MGQWRKIAAIEGDKVLLDRPWEVVPDRDSLVSVTALISQFIIADNDFQDLGVAIQFYGVSAEHIVSGNSFARAMGAETAGRFYRFEQPNWYVQFLGNKITEGNIYRSGPNQMFLSGLSYIAVFGLAPRPDFPWPMACAHVVRGNQLDNNALIKIGGRETQLPAVLDVVVEDNSVSDSPLGVTVDSSAAGILLRNNQFTDVDKPLSGAGADRVLVDPH
jgi:hypothetical protein